MYHEAMITNKMVRHQPPPPKGVFCLWGCW